MTASPHLPNRNGNDLLTDAAIAPHKSAFTGERVPSQQRLKDTAIEVLSQPEGGHRIRAELAVTAPSSNSALVSTSSSDPSSSAIALRKASLLRFGSPDSEQV
ncbi:MAG: hypothetical protein HC936_16745 [Leptolyngbyaceae cyanobacterium SU_3_3]|nr:hypothetical protein [Leptolyngbyaceae cyanobacterium SU_3_3]